MANFKKLLICLMLVLSLTFTGCMVTMTPSGTDSNVMMGGNTSDTNTDIDSDSAPDDNGDSSSGNTSGDNVSNDNATGGSTGETIVPDVPSTETGDKVEDTTENAGDLESSEDVEVSTDLDFVTCVSGTQKAYTYDADTGTLAFGAITEDTVYSIKGELNGNIVIDVVNDYKFDLELCGVTLSSSTTNPIFIKSGNKVSITAKNGYENKIYDARETVDPNDTTLYSAAIYSMVDLEICGKGSLTVVSDNNNGIRTKDDLEVKNLTLKVTCVDNALKGNDSVTIESGNLTLISTSGDGIKTDNSDISEKGNQRGYINILGGTTNIYCACDGIDASYDAVISGTDTVVNIYTDRYSDYSEEVTATTSGQYYIKYNSNAYSFSVKYTNSSTNESVFKNATYYTSTSSSSQGGGWGRPGQSSTTYYYYTVEAPSGYDKLQVYMYNSSQTQGQDSNYYACTESKSLNTSNDTISLSGTTSLSLSWTNYTTSSMQPGGGGMGGMQEGNTDKGDYSTKGIKASNAITISGGTILIKAYDDAIHANKTDSTGTATLLGNGSYATGNVTLSGGTISVLSHDDGVHADGTLLVNGAVVNVSSSYEGLEGNAVQISGGYVSIKSTDDGINGANSVSISGGNLYMYTTGDGLDSNGTLSISGGYSVVISNSNGNAALDSDTGYTYTGGKLVAVMPSGGMTSEVTNCNNFSSIGTKTTISLSASQYFTVKVSSNVVLAVQNPASISAMVVYLGSNSATISTASSVSYSLDGNGVYWAN